jgi:hypothetical protein
VIRRALLVAALAACPSAALAQDAGGAVTAVSLDPANGSGSAQVFHAVYAYTGGAAQFRVVQIWVGPQPGSAGNSVGPGYEPGAGGLYLDGNSCLPGDARTLFGTNGSLDCAKTHVSASGSQQTVDWALSFDVARMGGAQGVYFDAKAFPEPGGARLGWTKMGTFTVVAVPDGGSPPASGDASTASAGEDAATDEAADGSQAHHPPSESGVCGCSAAGTAPALLCALAPMALRRRRARPRPPAPAPLAQVLQRRVTWIIATEPNWP